MAQMRRLAPVIAVVAVVAAAVGWTLTRSAADPRRQPVEVAIDCEAASSGPVRQPVNAWTALAYSALGAAVLSRRDLHSLLSGITLAGTGLASFVFHATLASWSARLDGLAVAALAGVLALWSWPHRARFGAIGAIAFAAACWSRAATTALAVAFAAAVAARLFGKQSRRQLLLARSAAALFLLGAALWLMGRSGAPWCRPESLIQPHAAWHLISAAGLCVLVARLRLIEQTTPADSSSL